MELLFKVEKRAKIRNRYNQASHLTQDTNKAHISPGRPTNHTNLRDIFTAVHLFANFTVLTMEFLIKNCVPFCLPN